MGEAERTVAGRVLALEAGHLSTVVGRARSFAAGVGNPYRSTETFTRAVVQQH
jgi:hypothetical protein